MALILDEETHKYTLDGKPLDGVTETIRLSGLMPSYEPQDLEWYLQRGQAIHKATELYDKGTLKESTVDERIVGYLESYKKLGLKYKPDEIEIKLADPIYLVGGTLDRIDCDLKSGVPLPWHMVQAGIYWQLKKINGLDKCLMKTWYLQEDGSYPKIKTYTMQELLQGIKIFYAALVVVRAKKEFGI